MNREKRPISACSAEVMEAGMKKHITGQKFGFRIYIFLLLSTGSIVYIHIFV